MKADIRSSARVVQLDYEINRATVRFEGLAPEIGADVLLHAEQCGWIDEFGNVFPMGAWNPATRTYLDGDKATWRPVYAQPKVLTVAQPPALFDARERYIWSLGFGAGKYARHSTKDCEWTNCPHRVGDVCCHDRKSP